MRGCLEAEELKMRSPRKEKGDGAEEGRLLL